MQSKRHSLQGQSYTKVPSILTRTHSRTTQTITLSADSYLSMHRLLHIQAMVTCTYTYMHTYNTSFIHFPFSNFRYFLTLFSKFFSSFLHSTCSLSVSRQYLALDGIYHPLVLQSQATRLVGSAPYAFVSRHRTGLSPSMVQDSTWIIPKKTPVTTPIDYNSLIWKIRDFKVELFPLHSPLLRESWLVSFPPLSYMLKFSGSSCLISGPIYNKLISLQNHSEHTVNLSIHSNVIIFINL